MKDLERFLPAQDPDKQLHMTIRRAVADETFPGLADREWVRGVSLWYRNHPQFDIPQAIAQAVIAHFVRAKKPRRARPAKKPAGLPKRQPAGPIPGKMLALWADFYVEVELRRRRRLHLPVADRDGLYADARKHLATQTGHTFESVEKAHLRHGQQKGRPPKKRANW
jgi:hypothetical protein